jgi:hypothetical protein
MSAIHTSCTVCHPAEISKSSKKRWIPADLVQNTAEFSGSVASLVSFRGVSSEWQDAVSDAVGFLNGRCWTQLEEESDGPLRRSLCHGHPTADARRALLCQGHRLETLTWRYVGDQLDFPLRLLVGENNTVLTTLILGEDSGCRQTADVSLQSCRALTRLDLAHSSIANAGICDLEHNRTNTLEELHFWFCKAITNVNCLQTCRALKKLCLVGSRVTNFGIRGLELIPTLEELDLQHCRAIKDVSRLQSCRALKKLNLVFTNVTNEGIRGLDLIPTLEVLNLWGCKNACDLSSALRNRPDLQIIP